jgi:ABC-2 type transport system permease protein
VPTLPAALLGVRGPISRAFADQLPRALSWGIGIGVMAATLASLAGPMAQQIAASPDLLRTFRIAFPGFDLTSAGSFLQLFLQLFYIAAGFAAATFVAKWGSDETDGRLEQILATPQTRAGWLVAGGIGALLSAAVMTLIVAAGIGLGGASGEVAVGTAMLGSISLWLYAAAVIGVGVAVGGLWRTSLAAEIAAVAVVVTYLIDLLVPPLNLPDWVHQLALTSHLGQPTLGEWDPLGIGLCLVIALGGLLVGAVGIRRRDISR